MISALQIRGKRAGWQSGYAADCNSVYAGSIPTPASTFPFIDTAGLFL